jgi:hypothetical protein
VNALSTLIRGQSKPWERPVFDMPALTSERDLTFLGADRGGRRWFSHKRYGEMAEGPIVDASRQELPNSVLVEIGPDKYRLYGSLSAPGTYQRLTSMAVRAPKPPKPHRPVDALGHLWLVAPRSQRPSATVVGGRGAEPEPAAGPAGILERLAQAGATVRLSTDRTALVTTTSGGALGPGILELVDRVGPMLVAHLNGTPLACTVSKHDRPTPATTYALGGAPWCGICGGAS